MSPTITIRGTATARSTDWQNLKRFVPGNSTNLALWNGQFLILADAPDEHDRYVGDCINEQTFWTFDFSGQGASYFFKRCRGPITAAVVTLTLAAEWDQEWAKTTAFRLYDFPLIGEPSGSDPEDLYPSTVFQDVYRRKPLPAPMSCQTVTIDLLAIGGKYNPAALLSTYLAHWPHIPANISDYVGMCKAELALTREFDTDLDIDDGDFPQLPWLLPIGDPADLIRDVPVEQRADFLRNALERTSYATGVFEEQLRELER